MIKSLLAKLALRKAVGVYVDEHAVTVSYVARTHIGPVEIESTRAPLDGGEPGPILERLLAPYLGSRRPSRVPVALGLPTMRVFFSTRPVRSTHGEASPQVLLHEVLQSPTLNIDDMVVEAVKTQPGRRRLASLVSCRKKYLSPLVDALQACGIGAFRAEPEACALLRVAERRQRTPLRARVVLRMFLAESQGLAVVTAGKHPVVWRLFDLPAGREDAALRAAVRSLQTLTDPCGLDAPIDTVIFHGRPDLAQRPEAAALAAQLDLRVLWAAEPKLDAAAVAFGLAVGCLTPQEETLDLAGHYRPRPTIRDLFPTGELALQGALLLCLGLFLNFHGQNLQDSLQSARAANAQYERFAALSEGELEARKNTLDQQVKGVERFLGGRIVWSAYTRDVAAALPRDAVLDGFDGICELGGSGKPGDGPAKPNKALVLQVSAPMDADGATPVSVEQFVDRLKEHPRLRQEFPLIEPRHLSSRPAHVAKPTYSSTVICLPRKEIKPPEGRAEARPMGPDLHGEHH